MIVRHMGGETGDVGPPMQFARLAVIAAISGGRWFVTVMQLESGRYVHEADGRLVWVDGLPYLRTDQLVIPPGSAGIVVQQCEAP